MLKKLNKTKSEGFTIIEVMIVLAIAGLILLIVFLAVPALQRNSRNTQRKNDVSALLGAANEYINNHNGSMPTSAANITSNAKLGYYDSATNVDFAANSNTAIGTAATIDKVFIRTGAKCNSANDDVGGSGPSARALAIVYQVETSGSTQSICQES
jgi:prepilin-type N-terminal cleavage/methylation domain-containing protein